MVLKTMNFDFYVLFFIFWKGNDKMKKILCLFLIVIFCFSGTNLIIYSSFNITLDPGHGANASGAQAFYDGKLINEKDLNLKIGLFIREELSKYKTARNGKVNVYLTRYNDGSNPSLSDRVNIAKNNRSSVLVSLHCNARPHPDKPLRGAMVLVTSSNYHNLYSKEEKLARLILQELNNIGIPCTQNICSSEVVKFNKRLLKPKFELKEGILRRLSNTGYHYPNGDYGDYYGIVRHGTLKSIPTVLIEHCHIDFEDDYRRFLSSDDKLRELAKADVRAIARCYNLKIK